MTHRMTQLCPLEYTSQICLIEHKRVSKTPKQRAHRGHTTMPFGQASRGLYPACLAVHSTSEQATCKQQQRRTIFCSNWWCHKINNQLFIENTNTIMSDPCPPPAAQYNVACCWVWYDSTLWHRGKATSGRPKSSSILTRYGCHQHSWKTNNTNTNTNSLVPSQT